MRRTRSRRHARHNPTAAVAGKQPASLGQALSTERLKAMFKTSVILGGGAFVGVMGINKLFEKVDALNGIQSEYTKAALKAAIGVVGGLVLGFAVPAAAPLAAGLAIGGVYVGVDMAVAKYRLDNPGTPAVNPPANPNPPAVNPPAPGTTPPANGVYGMAYRPANGAELPAGYTAYTAAACASR